MKPVVVVPTYNERENVSAMAEAVLANLPPEGEVLFVDDNSPDGTGGIIDGIAAANPRVHCLHRTAKEGLGRAYVAGFKEALRLGADRIVEMDCDFSHPVDRLGDLLAVDADVVIGSRYVKGGKCVGWPFRRWLISRCGGLFIRTVTGMPVKDPTGGFKCFRRKALEDVGLDGIESNGYSFQLEMNHRMWMLGFSIVEIPITFSERRAGYSKISGSIAVESVKMVLKLWKGVGFRRSPRKAGRASLLGLVAGLLAVTAFAGAAGAGAVVADFSSGGVPEGWAVENGEYRSPLYPNAVDRIEIRHAGSAADGTAAVYASSNKAEAQVATFTAAASAAAFDFPETADFRSFRIVTANGLALSSFAAFISPAINACRISSLARNVYSQNFDSLADVTATTGDKDWLNGTTLQYWQAYKGTAAVTTFKYNGGAGKIGGLYALSLRQDEVRALGAYSTKDAEFSFGIAFTNDTDMAMKLSSLSYSAQQWGFKNTTNQALSVCWKVADSLDWISAHGDGWTELASSQSAVYGSEAVHDTPVSMPVNAEPQSSASIAPGQILMLKWTVHSLKLGTPGMMGIDDVSVSFSSWDRGFVFRLAGSKE